MIKFLATSRRRPGMTYAEYIDYNVYSHGKTTRDHPVAIRRYVQSHVFDSVYGQTGDTSYPDILGRDAVSELYFTDQDALIRTFSDPRVLAEAIADGQNYNDVPTSVSMICEEIDFPVTFPGHGGLKVMQFLRAKAGVADADFIDIWQEAHSAAIAAADIGDLLRGAVMSAQIMGDATMLSTQGAIPLRAVVTLRFDLPETGARMFRRYLDMFMGVAADPVDHSTSFALLTREIVLFDRD